MPEPLWQITSNALPDDVEAKDWSKGVGAVLPCYVSYEVTFSSSSVCVPSTLRSHASHVMGGVKV